jgi:hypothetical protein
MSTWVAGGVFTPQLHKVDEYARTMRVEGRRYWWSQCNAVCVPIPLEVDTSKIPLCDKCFPTRERTVCLASPQ